MAALSELTGTVIGGYRIDFPIASGGMGHVFRATDLASDQPAALKILNPYLGPERDAKARFLSEARLAASLDHPHIVPIWDAGEEHGFFYIAMQYVDGDDLGSMIRGADRLDLSAIPRIMSRVADALDAAHARGLIHRDVKPENILIRREDGEIFLTDFGLTRSLHESRRTQTGELLGTVHYMAPEHIEGHELDARADIYSLGCLLYEMLTGEVPFERGSGIAVLWAHVHADVPSARHLRPELGPEWDRLLTKALAKSPTDRFATCEELASAVAIASETRARSWSRLFGRTRRTSHWVRRSGTLAATIPKMAAVGAGVLVISGSTFLMLDRLSADERNRPSAQAGSSEGRRQVASGKGPGRRNNDDTAARGTRSGPRDRGRQADVDTDGSFAFFGGGSGREAEAPVPNAPQMEGTSAPRVIDKGYDAVGVEGYGLAECDPANNLGCIDLVARAGETLLDLEISDSSSSTVRAWIRQDSDGDGRYEGDWHEICNRTARPIPITPGATINVLLRHGTCGGRDSFPTTGTITATFR